MGLFNNKYSKKISMVMNSASLALFISILFFAYETVKNRHETEEIVGNLMKIQNSFSDMESSFFDIENSLSTRYLGIFPEYIDDINSLLTEALSRNIHSRANDTIIVFEDVLHYGVLSDPKGFKMMMRNLLELSMQGCNITIVHYDNMLFQFKQLVTDELIHPTLLTQYKEDRRALRHVYRTGNSSFETYYSKAKSVIDKYFSAVFDLKSKTGQEKVMAILQNSDNLDSCMLEYNFRQSKRIDRKKYENSLRKINTFFSKDSNSANDRLALGVADICASIDSIKRTYMSKSVNEVTYHDYLNLYRGMTSIISEKLSTEETIQTIPINESIMMCCWMIDVDGIKKAIFAFPSKYSTDEIGFISRDAAIIKYINTMLRGVKNNLIY